MTASLHYRRIRNSLTLEGLVFVVILAFVAVCAVLRNVNLLVVVSGMMFASLLLTWRLNRHTIRHVTAQRSTPPRFHAGQPGNIQWRVTNHSRWTSFGLTVSDRVRPRRSDDRAGRRSRRGIRGAGRGVVIYDRIDSGQTRHQSYRAMFARRGIYELGPAVVSNRFPWPLVRCWFRTYQMDELAVAPRLGQLASNWKQQLAGLSGRSTWRSQLRRLDEDEFFAIRDWRSGDHMRKIHWRSTAKQGRPMVKQFDRPETQEIAIVLDLCAGPRSADGNLGNDDRSRAICETLLSFAATVLTQHQEATSGRFVIGIAGETSVVRSSSVESQFVDRALRDLAMAEPSANPDIGVVLARVSEVLSHGTPCCILSSRPATGWPESEAIPMSWARWIDAGEPGFERLFTPAAIPVDHPAASPNREMQGAK